MNKSLHGRTKVRSGKHRKAEVQRCETLFTSFLMIVIYRHRDDNHTTPRAGPCLLFSGYYRSWQGPGEQELANT